MSFAGQPEKIFVSEEEIPAEFKPPFKVNQKTFLLNGEMVYRDRPVQEVSCKR